MEKKDFWKMSWNPVWGCLNTCPYCYARRICNRMWKKIWEKEVNYHVKNNPSHAWTGDHLTGLKNFKPTWLESNYWRKFPKKPCIIFANSMSDLAYWKKEWYEKIVSRIAENIQHTFVVLTKDTKVYKRFAFPHNTILGVTCTNQLELNRLECDLCNWWEPINPVLISIEPIQEKVQISTFLKRVISWIHVGEESGNRKGRVKATKEMIEPFFNLDIPVFMKDNLERVFPGKLKKEFPAWNVIDDDIPF